ncbi:MAG: SLAP domain-containing protein [Lactobacillaceae bacterium]
MKKSSLMGASVVAAALLAAAPVVAPVASLATPATQVVKADAQSARNEAISKIKAQSTGTTLFSSDDLSHFTTALHGSLGDLQKDAYIDPTDAKKFSDSTTSPFTINDNKLTATDSLLKYFFNGSQGVDLMTSENTEAVNGMRYTLRFDYSSAINNLNYQIKNDSDVTSLQNDLANNGGTVTMTMQLYNGESEKISNGIVTSTVSYNVNNNRAAYVSYNDTLNAKVNDSASIFGLSNSFVNGGGKIVNYNGQDITQAAYDAGAITVTPLHDANGHAAAVAGEVVDGNFVKAGTYYQTIKINLATAKVNVPNNKWVDAVNNGLITVNGQKPSLNNADANVFLVTSDGTLVDGYSIDAGTLVLKRVVNVGSANLATKDEKVNGVVTVHTSDVTTAPLYDEAGNVIVDRSVTNNSKWKTDLKRTVYANGKVFYRVSTHEYISADQVTFAATDTSSSSDVIKGDVVVTPLPSRKVIKVNNAGTITDLWNKSDDNKSMTRNPDRHVPGESLWQTDQTATINGATYYRVSTNEWINAKFVTLQ